MYFFLTGPLHIYFSDLADKISTPMYTINKQVFDLIEL